MSEPLIADDEIIPLWVTTPCPPGSENPDDAVISFARRIEALVRKRLAERLTKLAPSMATTIRLRDALRIVSGEEEK